MPNGTPAQLANLKHWRPGESGSARGRLASHREVLRLARKNSEQAARQEIGRLQATRQMILDQM